MNRFLTRVCCFCLLAWYAPALCVAAQTGVAAADIVTCDQILAAVETARDERRDAMKQYLGDTDFLRDVLAKAPPGPGWADFGWTTTPVVGELNNLWILLTFAKDLGLYGRRDQAVRTLFACLARRCEAVAAQYAPGMRDDLPYAKHLAHLPQYQRAVDIKNRPYPTYARAWGLAAAFFRQQAGDGPVSHTERCSPVEATPAFRKLEADLAALRIQADAMARRHGAGITRNWPVILAWTLEISRVLTHLWDMALTADISEKTSVEGLRMITDLYRYEEDRLALFTSGWMEQQEGYPPQSPPERRFARKLLRAMKAYERAADSNNRTAIVNKAEAFLDAR